MRRGMKIAHAAALLLLVPGLTWAQDKGICPLDPQRESYPNISHAAPPPPAPPVTGATYLGTAGFLAGVSDRGYVCSASVVRSVDQQLDEQALRTVEKSRFRPARMGRRHIPTAIVINVPLWRAPDGKLISDRGLTIESPPGFKARNP